MQSSRLIKGVLAGSMLAVASLGYVALADDKNAPPAIAYRHHVMEAVGKSFGNLVILSKGGVSYAGHDALMADILLTAAKASKVAFEEDTSSIEYKSDSKAEIWSNWDDFAGKLDKFVVDAEAIKTAAASGDRAAVGAAVRAMGRNCKGCHDDYKAD